MSPDVVVAEGDQQLYGAANFLNILNGAPNSPGDWALAPFMPNSGDSSNALFYRTSKVTYLSVLTLNEGTGSGPGMPAAGITSAGASGSPVMPRRARSCIFTRPT